jgi:short subunit dehydrogenase-like uncharacterized protein
MNVALLGATGYTGRLVAEELARRGIAARLGGRSAERLEAVVALPDSERFVVDVSSAARLDEFLDGIDVVINTVGPFVQLGMPVVEAAVRNEVAYIDSTGETTFMEDVYLRFSGAPVPVVPASAFDYVPGDLCAAVAAAEVEGPVSRVDVRYSLGFVVPSRGTATTGLGMMEAGGEVGGERQTVPRHVPGAEVTVDMGLPTGPLRALAPLLRPALRLLPEGPSPRMRERATFTITATASGDAGNGGSATVECTGRDVYGLTARFLVEAAGRLRGTGAMAPAEALDPVPFLDAVSGSGPTGEFSWRRR